jgi:GWxTD domain-containing protein
MAKLGKISDGRVDRQVRIDPLASGARRSRKPGIGAAAALFVLSAVAACGGWQRVGGAPPPADPSTYVSRLFDVTTVYRGMGLLAADRPQTFVAGVRYLAGPVPDSTEAIFGLALSNRTLTFRRTGGVFEARYRVEVEFRQAGHAVERFSEERPVRVSSFPATESADQTVAFQRTFRIPPGRYQVEVIVRDLNGSGIGHASAESDAPRYVSGRAISSLVPVYRARRRTSVAESPDVVLNPKAAVPYGSDTLLLYAEAYDADSTDFVTIRAVARDPEPTEVWRDSARVGRRAGPVTSLLFSVRPSLLPIGELEFSAVLSGTKDTVRTPILVSFSDQWAVANLDETLSLLRYFGAERALQEIKDAPPQERVDLWRRFWRETDPDPRTPENETLEVYFARLEEANERFREGSDPGWLTDRGQVFVTLGPPDEFYDSSSDLVDNGIRLIRWYYTAEHLILDFVDETGFGKFLLTSRSRDDYMQVLARVRRGG